MALLLALADREDRLLDDCFERVSTCQQQHNLTSKRAMWVSRTLRWFEKRKEVSKSRSEQRQVCFESRAADRQESAKTAAKKKEIRRLRPLLHVLSLSLHRSPKRKAKKKHPLSYCQLYSSNKTLSDQHSLWLCFHWHHPDHRLYSEETGRGTD